MDDPVPCGDQLYLREGAFEPAKQISERVLMGFALRQMLVDEDAALPSFAAKWTWWPTPSNSPSQMRSDALAAHAPERART